MTMQEQISLEPEIMSIDLMLWVAGGNLRMVSTLNSMVQIMEQCRTFGPMVLIR